MEKNLSFVQLSSSYARVVLKSAKVCLSLFYRYRHHILNIVFAESLDLFHKMPL